MDALVSLLGGSFLWKNFAIALLVFGVCPGPVLRLLLLAFSKDHHRRLEVLAEFYAIRGPERLWYVTQCIELALFEGLPARQAERRQRRASLRGTRWRRFGQRRRVNYEVRSVLIDTSVIDVVVSMRVESRMSATASVLQHAAEAMRLEEWRTPRPSQLRRWRWRWRQRQ